MIKKKLVSILIPFYNEENSLLKIVEEIKFVESKINEKYILEIILLDNCSNDNSPNEAKQLSNMHENIIYFKQSRNFGYQANILSGYKMCNGDAAIQLDADGQDDPNLIIEFLNKWEEGYKVVYGIRRTRKENFLMKILRSFFYRFLNYISEINIPINAGDFRLVDKKIIKILNQFEERNIYLRGIFSYIGFKQIGIEYDRRKRNIGSSKFNIFSYFKLASIGIISFSKKPLLLIFFTGIIFFILSFFLLLYYLIQHLIGNIIQPGFSTLIIVLLSFFGLTFFYMGIISLYIAQIHDEVRKRPIYIPDNEEKE